MKKQLAFLVDAEKCVGCYSCAMACKVMYKQEKGVTWRNLAPLDEKAYPHRERAFFSLSCNHCEKPACVSVCPVKAYTKREDGVVVHDANKCIYCKSCISACSYGSAKDNTVLGRAEKCSMCHERLDKGLQPACVTGCTTGALTKVELSSMHHSEAKQYLPGFDKKTALNPSTRFIAPKAPKVEGTKKDS